MSEPEDTALAWRLLVELRKETIESQRLRAQIVGLKITFVSTVTGLIAATMDMVPVEILALPGFAAVFLDLLINSYSISIKRIGLYCRTCIEPLLRAGSQWPQEVPLWEEFMSRPEVKQGLSLVGNLGITSLAVVIALYFLISTFRLFPSLPVLIILVLLYFYDIHTFLRPRRIAERGFRERE